MISFPGSAAAAAEHLVSYQGRSLAYRISSHGHMEAIKLKLSILDSLRYGI